MKKKLIVLVIFKRNVPFAIKLNISFILTARTSFYCKMASIQYNYNNFTNFRNIGSLDLLCDVDSKCMVTSNWQIFAVPWIFSACYQ